MNKGYSSLLILLLITAVSALVYLGFNNLQKGKTVPQSSKIAQSTPIPSASPAVCPNQTWDYSGEKLDYNTKLSDDPNYCLLLDPLDNSLILIYPAAWIPIKIGAFSGTLAFGTGEEPSFNQKLVVSGYQLGYGIYEEQNPPEKKVNIPECASLSCKILIPPIKDYERVIRREIREMNNRKFLYLVTTFTKKAEQNLFTRYFFENSSFEFYKEDVDINSEEYKKHQEIVEKIIASYKGGE